MKKTFLIFSLIFIYSSISFAEFQLVPTNCTNKKTGTTYFCNSEKCVEIQEALADYQDQAVSNSSEKKESKKSKIPKFNKKKKEKKSKIPKFKKSE